MLNPALILTTLFPLACLVTAETPPGFALPVRANLNVSYGSNYVSPPGERFSRPEVAQPPTVRTPVFTSSGRGVLMMIDSDVPRNGTRVPLLHWLVANVTRITNSTELSILSPGITQYLQPSPPVGDIPHTYTFVLFGQPENFTVPGRFNQSIQDRVGFNWTDFIRETGLNATALTANYITVQNLTGVNSTATTFPPPRPTTEPTEFPTSGAPSNSEAGKVAIAGEKPMWAGVGMAVLAGVAAVAL